MKIVVKITRDVDGYYRARCPALPGCFAYAPSHEEAAARINDAIRGYLASLDSALPGNVEQQVLMA